MISFALSIDVAIVHVSPPDSHGYCSLGASVDIARSAVNTAQYVIAQVNPNSPRTHGDGMIHSSRFQAMIYCEDTLHTANFAEDAGIEIQKIGAFVAGLIDDKCTIKW